MDVFWRENASVIVRKVLMACVAGVLLIAGTGVQAQEEAWSNPVMISTNTLSSWFPDVTVDAHGQPHIVWNSGRPTDRGQMDLLMYSTLGDQGWLEPNDVLVTAYGGFTIRPAVAADENGILHVTFRGETSIYYARSAVSTADSAASWSPRKRISGAGAGAGYYSDIAVDKQGTVHVVWNESVSAGVDERWLWFGTQEGAVTYDGLGWRTRSELGLRQVYAMVEGEDGAQLFGTNDGVYRFDGYTWSKLGLTGRSVYCVATDGYGRLWFGTEGGVRIYDEEAEEEKWASLTVDDGLPGNRVSAIALDLRGRVWVGTDSGVARYDGSWTSYSTEAGLPASQVTTLAVDREGAVWVGTTGGVGQYVDQTWKTHTEEDGLWGEQVTSIVAAPDGTVWVGTNRGLSRYANQRWTLYTPDQGVVGGPVTSLLADSGGDIWVGTEEGIGHYDGQIWETLVVPQEIAGTGISAIAEDLRPNVACPMCGDVFYRRSTDRGRSWSAPINLSNSFMGSVKPQVRVTDGGGVHVSWEEGDDWYAHQGYPTGSAYVHSLDGGTTWIDPIMFSFSEGEPQQITFGLGRENRVVVVWRLPQDDHFYYQFSQDDGVTWSRPKHIPGLSAKHWLPFSLDAYDTATDSAGNVHMLVLGRLQSLDEDLGVIHLAWDGAEWSSPNRVFASTDPPEWPRISIGAGNRVCATWFTRDERHIWESERGQYKIWASCTQAGAPSVTASPFPTPEPTPTRGEPTRAASLPTVSPVPTTVLENSGLPTNLYTEGDEVGRLLLALAPAALAIVGVVLWRAGWLKRRP